MQTESERIRILMEQNWQGPMWYGSNLKETLKDISWEKAFIKPGHASHNIYEYLRHMIAWRKFTVEQIRGNGEYRIQINSDIDWIKEYKQTEEEWTKVLKDLDTTQSELVESWSRLTDNMLGESANGRSFSWYSLLHGIIHHDIYHSAQINLLKKQIV